MSTAGKNGRKRALLFVRFVSARCDTLGEWRRHCEALSDVDYARPRRDFIRLRDVMDQRLSRPTSD